MHTRRCSLIFLTLVTTIVGVAAQEVQNKRFSGTWQAKVKDTVVCTIELRAEQEITGALKACHIKADADGNLVEPEPSDGGSEPSPISNGRITGSVLTFDYRDEGDAESVNFEMTLVGEGTADLVVKNAPVKIKPIRFVRASSGK